MIEVRGLTKRFDGVLAVDDLSFEVQQGEVFGLLGPNGAGKTTTVRMLSCLIAPTVGQASVAGLRIGVDDAEIRQRVGILTEAPGLYERLSARKNLEIYAALYGVTDIAGQVEKYLRMLELWDRREESVRGFSKGVNMERPLILITNDDGIASPGLRAVAETVCDLGEILVVAPKNQQSGASRHFLANRTCITEVVLHVDGQKVAAYAISGSPAQTVRWGLLTLAPRKPTIAISGINYGENVGVGITISGTVGAAIEAASFGIPSLAVSLETDPAYHLNPSDEVDFSAAMHFMRLFAIRVLRDGLPPGVDILKIDVPQSATSETDYRVTRVSRQQYFHSTVEEDENGRRLTGYHQQIDLATLEPDSDIYALAVDRVVSVSPITIDLTAKVDLRELSSSLRRRLG